MSNSIVIGQDKNGHDILIDFDIIPSLLVAGCPHIGKTLFLKKIVTYLSVTEPECFFLIVDFKYDWKNFENAKNVEYITEMPDAVERIIKLSDEIRNNCFGNKRIYLIIDDLANLMLFGKKRAEKGLSSILLSTFSKNIRVFAITHIVDYRVFTNLLAVNMNYRIVFRMEKKDSLLLLGHSGAENFSFEGQCIYSAKGSESECIIA